MADLFRLVRVVEYIGSREAIERVVQKSIHIPRAPRANIVISAATLSSEGANGRSAEVALGRAAQRAQLLTELGSQACDVLGVPHPGTRSEKNLIAHDAYRALAEDEGEDEDHLRWDGRWQRDEPRAVPWSTFKAKVRELAPAIAPPCGHASCSLIRCDPVEAPQLFVRTSDFVSD